MEKPTKVQIEYLKSHPETADRFDAKFGKGLAAKLLPRSTFDKYAGAVTRGLAGPALGAAMGAPLGPVGMLAGSLAVPAGDALTALVNAISSGVGSDKRLTSPSQGIQQLLTRAGVAQPGHEATGRLAAVEGWPPPQPP